MTLSDQSDDALPLTDFINALPNPAPWGNRPLPKIIWLFWHSGLKDAPEVVRRSLTTWQHFNPDHEVRFLDLAEAEAVLGIDLQALFEKLTVDLGWAGKSDLIRLMLLAKFGGVWADATTFCLKPLSEWLHDEIYTNGFFCFRWESKVSDRDMISWFLASIPGHPLTVRSLVRSQEFLFKKRDQNLTIMSSANFLRALGIAPGERRGVDALAKCENLKKKTTYFWIFYIFKTVFDKHPREYAHLKKLSNRYAQHASSLNVFRDSYVSKQTYKDVSKEIYKTRLELMFDGDAVRGDFHERLKNVHWSKIRNSLAISEDRKIIFVHIPKCGGTSIDRSDLFEGGIHRHGHPEFLYFKKILGSNFSQFRLLTLVRNPWDRLASAFHWASAEAMKHDRKDAVMARDHLTEFEDDLIKFLPQFCKDSQKFIGILWFRPAISFFNPAQCDIPYFIQKLEEKDNLGPLRQFLGMPDFQLGHERAGTTPPPAKSAFTEEIFRKVGEIYAADVQAFGYQDTTMAQLKY